MFGMMIYVFLISNLSYVQSEHFLGGTISWKAMNNTDGNAVNSVMFTQSYQWNALETGCNQSRIYNLPSVPSLNDTLSCVSNTSLCGGFLPLDTKGYCIDSSILLDARSTQLSIVENITANSTFCIAFRSIYWRTIRSPLCNFTCYSNTSRWSIGSCINLIVRSEGFINTSPVAAAISPIRISVNSSVNITIPIVDADNDVVRCRWAQKTSILDECLDICGVLPGSTLYSNNCTLTFNSTGKTVGDYYAVALMVEDFSNTSTNISLSRVPVQFLIEIVDASSCPLKPTISSNISNCTAIYVGVQLNFTLEITQGCLNTTIVDFFAMSPLNMFQSNLTQNGSSNTWNISQTWTPTVDQLGLQVFCSVALDSNGTQSDQYCLIFNVVFVGQDLLCPGEIAPTTVTTVMTTVSTAAPVRTIIQTVVVPDTSSSNFKFTNFDLTLALGLSLPLLLAFGGLLLYRCCCYQSKCFSSIFSRQNDALTKLNNVQTESNQKFVNTSNGDKDLPSQLPDYRQQYVNDKSKFPRNNQGKTAPNKSPITAEKPITPKLSSDVNQNSMNITKTTFFSPSTHSLGTSNVSVTRDYSPRTVNHGSVLVRAYYSQENQKTISN